MECCGLPLLRFPRRPLPDYSCGDVALELGWLEGEAVAEVAERADGLVVGGDHFALAGVPPLDAVVSLREAFEVEGGAFARRAGRYLAALGAVTLRVVDPDQGAVVARQPVGGE